MKGAQKEANCPRISCVGKDGLGLLFLGVLGLQVCTVVSDLWRVGGGKLRRYIVPIVLWV